jgi:hypothetical protein
MELRVSCAGAAPLERRDLRLRMQEIIGARVWGSLRGRLGASADRWWVLDRGGHGGEVALTPTAHVVTADGLASDDGMGIERKRVNIERKKKNGMKRRNRGWAMAHQATCVCGMFSSRCSRHSTRASHREA